MTPDNVALSAVIGPVREARPVDVGVRLTAGIKAEPSAGDPRAPGRRRRARPRDHRRAVETHQRARGRAAQPTTDRSPRADQTSPSRRSTSARPSSTSVSSSPRTHASATSGTERPSARTRLRASSDHVPRSVPLAPSRALSVPSASNRTLRNGYARNRRSPARAERRPQTAAPPPGPSAARSARARAGTTRCYSTRLRVCDRVVGAAGITPVAQHARAALRREVRECDGDIGSQLEVDDPAALRKVEHPHHADGLLRGAMSVFDRSPFWVVGVA